MDLIEILQTNGTGLLSGTCRLVDPIYLSFHDFFKTTEKSGEKNILVAFSLNEKNLGKFEIKCSGFIFEKERKGYKKLYEDMRAIGFHATFQEIKTTGPVKIWFEILWDPYEEEFGIFKAIKQFYA
ncbi:MAG TPA: hypothetical protein PLO44_02385 [Candidatus Paceibacterota bacterium]|nr:hypothetical protein [Candidatus Paceibacterota bacterium]